MCPAMLPGVIMVVALMVIFYLVKAMTPSSMGEAPERRGLDFEKSLLAMVLTTAVAVLVSSGAGRLIVGGASWKVVVCLLLFIIYASLNIACIFAPSGFLYYAASRLASTPQSKDRIFFYLAAGFTAQGWSPFVLFNRRRRQRLFLLCTFSMFAQIARADGCIDQHEIDTLERFMRDELWINGRTRREAVEIFRIAKNSSCSFDYYCREFYAVFRGKPAILVNMLKLLIDLAQADGEFDRREEALIERAAEMFEIRSCYISGLKRGKPGPARSENQAYQNSTENGPAQGSRTAGGAAQGDLDWCFRVLGCPDTQDIKAVKAHYRKLAKHYHPDRAVAAGLPPEFVRHADREFRRIHEAYERIIKARK